MEAKEPLSIPAPLIQSTVPHVTYSTSKPLADLSEQEWLQIETDITSRLNRSPLDLEAIHVAVLKKIHGFSLPSCMDQALTALKNKTLQNDVLALSNYGYVLFLVGNYQEALDEFNKAIRQGSPQAAFNLAKMYELGLGVPKDPGHAIGFYQQAAEKGLKEAIPPIEKNLPDQRAVSSLFILNLLSSPPNTDGAKKYFEMVSQTERKSVVDRLFGELTRPVNGQTWQTKKEFNLIVSFMREAFRQDDFTINHAVLARAIHWSAISTFPVEVERDFYFRVFNSLANLNQQEPRADIDTLGDVYLALLKGSFSGQKELSLNSWDRMSQHRLGEYIELYYSQTFDAARLFQKKYTALLEEWFQKFKSNDLDRNSLLDFLVRLATLDFPQIQSLLDRCYAWNAGRLIEEHRRTKAPADLSQLRAHRATHPKINRHLESFLFNIGADKKDAAIAGDNAAYQFLLDESKQEPIMMYWLGRYYEDYKGYSITYPTRAFNCYVDAGKNGSADAYYQLGQGYEIGNKLVLMQNVEKALYYYYFQAARLTSTSAITELKGFAGEKNKPRVRVLSYVYLALYTGLTGPVSQYYDNDYLKKAIMLDKQLAETVMSEICYNDDIDIHLRIALLQLLAALNPQSTKYVSSLEDFFKCNVVNWIYRQLADEMGFDKGGMFSPITGSYQINNILYPQSMHASSSLEDLAIYYAYYIQLVENKIVSFIQKMMTYINSYIFTDMTKIFLTDFLERGGPYYAYPYGGKPDWVYPSFFQISMGCVAAHFLTNYKHDDILKEKLSRVLKASFPKGDASLLRIEKLLKKNHALIDNIHFSKISTPIEDSLEKNGAPAKTDNTATSVPSAWAQLNAFIPNMASRITSSSSSAGTPAGSRSSSMYIDPGTELKNMNKK